ncbi:hypothetical protein M5G07_07990 [Serratia symbiotica]|nr:hypothetical protein [Serratia symbiotica]
MALCATATSKAKCQPPPGGKIEYNNAYSVFQVDGVLGLNTKPDSNFNAYISGLGTIFSLFPVTRQLL